MSQRDFDDSMLRDFDDSSLRVTIRTASKWQMAKGI